MDNEDAILLLIRTVNMIISLVWLMASVSENIALSVVSYNMHDGFHQGLPVLEDLVNTEHPDNYVTSRTFVDSSQYV